MVLPASVLPKCRLRLLPGINTGGVPQALIPISGAAGIAGIEYTYSPVLVILAYIIPQYNGGIFLQEDTDTIIFLGYTPLYNTGCVSS